MTQENTKILIRTYAGLEDVLLEEVHKLGGISPEKLTRGVQCEGDLGFVYKLNYALRTGIRVLIPLHEFTFRDNKSFYEEVKQIDWPSFFEVTKTITIDSLLFSDMFNNSMFVSQLSKDAIADCFRDFCGKRPYVDSKSPDIYISIYVRDNMAIVYLDSSGLSLHQRGYRKDQGKAPISEVLAAGILKLTGWTHHFPLLDPMCGAGTFAIEAALMANNVPPGILRDKFSFFHWKNFDKELLDTIVSGLMGRITTIPLRIDAFDKYGPVVGIAKANAKDAEVLDDIRFNKQDFFESHHSGGKSVLIMNPPYGERLDPGELVTFYQTLGSTLKHKYMGCEAWVITAYPEAIKHIGLKPSKKIKLFNGPLESLLLKYELYQGTKRGGQASEE
jgi:putative N6-adenine-specific DNA methylase